VVCAAGAPLRQVRRGLWSRKSRGFARLRTRASVAGFDDRSEFVDFYEVLGADPTADVASLRLAWRKSMKRVHPDVLRGQGRDPGREAVLVNSAWEVLSGGQRAAYDAQRRRILFERDAKPEAERWNRGERPLDAASWPWDDAATGAAAPGPSRLHVTGEDAEAAAQEARAWAVRAETPDELLALAVNQAVDAAREARGDPDAAVLAAARVVALREVARGREGLVERGGRFYLDRNGDLVDALPLMGPLVIALGMILMWFPRLLLDAPYHLASGLP